MYLQPKMTIAEANKSSKATVEFMTNAYFFIRIIETDIKVDVFHVDIASVKMNTDTN